MSISSVVEYLKPRPGCNKARRAFHSLKVEHLEHRLPLSASGYEQTNLAADVPGAALVHDPELIDAWGISINPNGTFWLSARATNVSTVYSGDVTQPDGSISPFVKSALTVTIPGDAPTGQVFNGTSDFVVSSGTQSAPARFIFASDTGHITGWNAGVPSPPAPSRIAHIMASTPGAVYTGLAISTGAGGNFLYATDFAGDKIDVFNGMYAPTTLAGSFVDPQIPDDYNVFNVQNLASKLYVTYARPHHEDPALPLGGGGFVSVFDTDGNFLDRLVTQDQLTAPWGIALAPADFGEFSGAIIVGNHRTGHLNAFDATSGDFLGRLRDGDGDVIQIDGLWGLHFGNGTASGDRNALYFVAAPDEGAHGLFGSLRAAAEESLDQPTGEALLLAAVDQLLAHESDLGATFDPQLEFSVPAFHGLNVAVERFVPSAPTIPPNPVRVAPVFALNYGAGSAALPSLTGLQNALEGPPSSKVIQLAPIFFGLFDGTVDSALN